MFREPAVKPEKGGGIITNGGGGDGGGAGEVAEGPISGLLVGTFGSGLDGSTRATGVSGAMLGILAAAVSLVWALYKFKPGLIGVGGAASRTAARPPAAVNQPQGNQEAPLLPPTTAKTATGDATDTQLVNGQTTSVDLAKYFSPMTTSTTMTRGVQADLDSGPGADGGGAAGWTVSSALATRSKFEEVTKSGDGGLSGAGTLNVGTQTGNLEVGVVGHGASATSSAAYSTYTHETRTLSDTTREARQVCKYTPRA